MQLQEDDVLQQNVESKDGLTYYSWYVHARLTSRQLTAVRQAYTCVCYLLLDVLSMCHVHQCFGSSAFMSTDPGLAPDHCQQPVSRISRLHVLSL